MEKERNIKKKKERKREKVDLKLWKFIHFTKHSAIISAKYLKNLL